MAAPTRTMVVRCFDWPVVAHGITPHHPAAVLVANRVVATSVAARRDNVERGLRRREAQARCPSLEVLDRDEAREARLFEPVVAAIEALTPRIEITRPGVCAFATRGPSRYFGGDAALVEKVTAVVTEAIGGRTSCRVGVADGPFAAALASRMGHLVEPGETPAFLAPLPITALERTELTDVLVRLGIPTLGDYAALGASDVLGRFGNDGALAHRLASGRDEHPPLTREPLDDLSVSAELDPPAERVDTVAFWGKALADELHSRLDRRGLACVRVAIEAETEHGEILQRLWRHEGALSAGAMADRVRWQLDGWLSGSAVSRPTGGLTRISLLPDQLVAAQGRQLGFWGGETEADERATRALTRVQGMLGPDSVLVPERRGGRGPGEQLTLVPAAMVDLNERRIESASDAPWPGSLPAPSPSLVSVAPVPSELVDADGAPVTVSGRGEVSVRPARLSIDGERWTHVVSWAGPWPVDERWWDPDSHRRQARFQLVLADGAAHLVALQGGRWWALATYD